MAAVNTNRLRPALCTGPFLATFSGHADGERRGLDRIGRYHRKGLGGTRLSLPSDRHGSLVFAVHRDVKKTRGTGQRCAQPGQGRLAVQGAFFYRHVHRHAMVGVPRTRRKALAEAVVTSTGMYIRMRWTARHTGLDHAAMERKTAGLGLGQGRKARPWQDF